MAHMIRYCPAGLSYEEFSRVDSECFPDEPIGSESFERCLQEGFWGAFDSGRLVGYCCVVRKPDFAWLSRIGVASSNRGTGVGTRLLKRAISYWTRTGLNDIILYVESGNEGAIRLYRRFGFLMAESACQYILRDPQHFTVEAEEEVRAVPMNELPAEGRPVLPRDWKDILEMHNPPEQYALVFHDIDGCCIGYCRLSPGFPGCFPFVVDEPEKNLKPVIRALRPLLLPEKDMLKLTFSSDELDRVCSTLGLELNYRLFKMIRSHCHGNRDLRKGADAE
ncbi:MAG: GNAT family N-acetyltransferase [Candidatus Fermentibacteraceae bacterium]|nr:GNAT family N-acetyltransferase [Candidatus Fermentibacteraceae bacterium]MBN2608948.1 GNAT family N-acetyltransferase [Candidatus Fermentibacteraceae bacterium]